MVFKNAHVRGGLSALAVVLAVADVGAQSPQGQRLQVVPVVRGDHLYVSAELRAREGLRPDVRAAIDSGLKTIFTYTIDLRLDAPGWFNRTIATAVVTNSVEYDNLQRSYTLERRIDGGTSTRRSPRTRSRVRQWMTSLKDLPLFSTKVFQPNPKYSCPSLPPRPPHRSILSPFVRRPSLRTRWCFSFFFLCSFPRAPAAPGRAALRHRSRPRRLAVSGADTEASLFLEGEAGVGKTSLAAAAAAALDTDLIRLQCYEGLDIGHAVYEWDYARQLVELRILEGHRSTWIAPARGASCIARRSSSSGRCCRRSIRRARVRRSC